MSEYFNQLTPAELERLSLLAEECGEAIQSIGKILRHGYESTHPDDSHNSNRGLLEDEVGDIICAMRIMCAAGDLRERNLHKRETVKRIKVQQYFHHQ